MILQWLNRASGIGFWLSAAGICVVGLLITADVVLRLARHPVPGGYELTELIMVIVVFAALAYTQREKGHIHVTMFVSKLPLAARLAVFGVMGAISTVMAGMITYGAFSQAGKSMSTASSSAVLEMPLYPFYYIEGIAMALFTLVLLLDTLKAFIGIRNQDIAHDVTKYWD